VALGGWLLAHPEAAWLCHPVAQVLGLVSRPRAGGAPVMTSLAQAEIKRMRDQLFFEAWNATAG
jgi:hypothetical protein